MSRKNLEKILTGHSVFFIPALIHRNGMARNRQIPVSSAGSAQGVQLKRLWRGKAFSSLRKRHAAAFVTSLVYLAASAIAQTERVKAGQDQAIKFRQAQRQLTADFSAVIANTANHTPSARRQAMEAFQLQNQGRFEALRLKAMTASRPAPVIPIVRQVVIPESGSPAMEEFLVQRAQMRNGQAAVLNAMREATVEQRQAALREWQEKNQPSLLALRERSTAITDEAKQKKRPHFPIARMPTDASPALKAFLKQRQTLIRAQFDAEMAVQHLPIVEREDALRQWRENRLDGIQPAAQEAGNPASVLP